MLQVLRLFTITYIHKALTVILVVIVRETWSKWNSVMCTYSCTVTGGHHELNSSPQRETWLIARCLQVNKLWRLPCTANRLLACGTRLCCFLHRIDTESSVNIIIPNHCRAWRASKRKDIKTAKDNFQNILKHETKDGCSELWDLGVNHLKKLALCWRSRHSLII